jgi:hypothetical protein
MDLDICGGAYNLKAPVSVQECINMFPEIEKSGSQSRRILRRFPGLKAFADPSAGGIRGMAYVGSTFYVVAGTDLVTVTAAGVVSASLGTIPGTAVVSMAHDGTNVIVVVGTTTQYTYNGSAFSTVTLPYASKRTLFLDTYFVHQRPDTNQFFISASGSATSYSALDIASKEGQPGNIVTMITSNRDLILFGTRTTETWRNTGNADFPFQRQEGTFQERGAHCVNCPVEMDNDVYYMGDDGVIYRMAGFHPQRISHHAIEKWMDEQSTTDKEAALGMTITHQGHYWYIISFAASTWVYDATVSGMSGEHEWFQLKSNDEKNWRVDVVERAFGKTLCGGADGVIYELDQDTVNENGEAQIKRRTTPIYHNERHPLSFNRLDLSFEEAVATSGVADPQVSLEISKDGGRTWSSQRFRSLGQLGQYEKKAIWRRNGVARTSIFRITVTDDVEVTFVGKWADVGVGSG